MQLYKWRETENVNTAESCKLLNDLIIALKSEVIHTSFGGISYNIGRNKDYLVRTKSVKVYELKTRGLFEKTLSTI